MKDLHIQYWTDTKFQMWAKHIRLTPRSKISLHILHYQPKGRRSLWRPIVLVHETTAGHGAYDVEGW
jgi:hypothetical protein